MPLKRNSRWPLSVILYFRGKRIWTDSHIADTISTYTPNLVKISRLALEICTKNKIRKNAPWRHNSIFGFQLLTPSFGDLRVCRYAKFQPNRTVGGDVIAILPFYFLGPILGQKWQTVLRVMETHSHSVGTMRSAHHRFLTFFRFSIVFRFEMTKLRRRLVLKFGSNLGLFAPPL